MPKLVLIKINLYDFGGRILNIFCIFWRKPPEYGTTKNTAHGSERTGVPGSVGR
jgi:hypothetical protein